MKGIEKLFVEMVKNIWTDVGFDILKTSAGHKLMIIGFFIIVATLILGILWMKAAKSGCYTESTLFKMFSVLIPFEILRVRLLKTDNAESFKPVILYNGRKVEESHLGKFIKFLTLIVLYALIMTFVLLRMQAAEYRMGCRIDDVFGENSGWECENTITTETVNCHSTFKDVLNVSLTPHEMELRLKEFTHNVECFRYNVNFGEAFALGYGAYKLFFLSMIALEKCYNHLNMKYGLVCAASTFVIITVICYIGIFILGTFEPIFFTNVMRNAFPFILSIVIAIMSSTFGTDNMTETVALGQANKPQNESLNESSDRHDL